MKKTVINLVSAIALTAASVAVQAKSLSEVGEDLVSKYANAVVEVQALSKMNIELGGMGTQNQEQELKVQATVVNDNGLIVTSYAALHPTYLVASAELPTQMGPINATISGETTNFRVRYADGTMVDAQMVLKDPETDLAFFKPVEKQAKVTSIAKAPTDKVELLEQTVVLSRGGELSNYAPKLSLNRISGILKKPIKSYMLGAQANPGAPIFNDDGELVGISLMKGKPGAHVKGGMIKAETLLVVQPIKQVLSAAKQAK